MNMTLNHRLFTSAALGLLASASSALAVPQVKMSDVFEADISGHYRADPNGELDGYLSNYSVKAKGSNQGQTWFGTFCLEANEYFTRNSTYNVAINTKAMNGGMGGQPIGMSGDPLSVGTAFLYESFATGRLDLLTNSIYKYTSHDRNKALQNVIWRLEGETFAVNLGADGTAAKNALDGLINTKFGSFAAAQANYSGKNVRVMNLTTPSTGTWNQDQLILVSVPEAGQSAAMLVLGLTGLATFARYTSRRRALSSSGA